MQLVKQEEVGYAHHAAWRPFLMCWRVSQKAEVEGRQGRVGQRTTGEVDPGSLELQEGPQVLGTAVLVTHEGIAVILLTLTLELLLKDGN